MRRRSGQGGPKVRKPERGPPRFQGSANLTAQGLANHAVEKPCKNDQKQADLYSTKSGSYHPRDGRPWSPSQKDCKKIRRQPKPAEPNLISERQRLVALIARLPDEVLIAALPAIESTLHQVSRQPCAKASRLAMSKTALSAAKFRGAGGECSKERHANGKLKQLPELPRHLRWPKKKYSDEFHLRGISIVVFLRERWLKLIAAGYNELRWLRMVDPSAAAAVENYERKDPETQKRKQLPDDVRFLREREVMDIKLSLSLDGARQDPRLLDAAARRARRGAAITPL
jgi:hypothetical protein